MTVGAYAEGFAEFWTQYPRKIGKTKALHYYANAVCRKGVSEAELLEGIKRARSEWLRKGTALEYIPHPTTWLREERWEDHGDFEAEWAAEVNAAKGDPS